MRAALPALAWKPERQPSAVLQRTASWPTDDDYDYLTNGRDALSASLEQMNKHSWLATWNDQ